MKKLLSLILALSLLLSLASCGDKGNESSQNESISNISGSSASSGSEEELNIVYLSTELERPFFYTYPDITKADYDKLWNAIVNNDEYFIGTENYYNSITDSVDLRNYKMDKAIYDMMYALHGNKPFTPEELINTVGNKIEITDERMESLKKSSHYAVYNADTNTFSFRNNFERLSQEGYIPGLAANEKMPFEYMGYRAVEDNKFEFYFGFAEYQPLMVDMFGKGYDQKNITFADLKKLMDVLDSEENGEIKYGGYMYSKNSKGEYVRVAHNSKYYNIIILEYKNGNIRWVNEEMHWIDDGVLGGTIEFLCAPFYYSKIPTE